MHFLKHKRLLILYALLFVWMGVIFWLSSEGHDASSGRSDAIVQSIQSAGVAVETDLLTFLTRKSAHILAYFTLGILAFAVIHGHVRSHKQMVLFSVIIPFLYSITDETHQLFVPGRSGEVRDVIIDSTAGILGVLSAYIIYRTFVLHKNQ